jgi:hypothetical protein
MHETSAPIVYSHCGRANVEVVADLEGVGGRGGFRSAVKKVR